MDQHAQIMVADLDRGAFLDLQKSLGHEAVSEKESGDVTDVHQELASVIALILLSPTAVTLLAKWLIKHRVFDFEYSAIAPDGSQKKVQLHFSSGEAKEKGFLERITAALTKAIFGSDDEAAQ